MTQASLFDLPSGLALRDKGIETAAQQKASLVIKLRTIAIEICRRQGRVTADDVMAEYVRRGGGIHDPGNAMGSVFRDKRFEFANDYVTSERIHARGNLLRVWRLAK